MNIAIHLSVWSIAALGVALPSAVARAADPTTSDCLAASDASLRSGNDHRLRAERSQLLTCAAASCPGDIRKECLRRVDEVNGQIPTVIFAAKDATGADLGAVRVMMDGELLAERLEGTALSVDPGEHTFKFETAGQAPVIKKLLIQQSQKERRESIAFGVPSDAVGSGGEPKPVVVTSAPEPARGGMGGQRIGAIAVGSVGIVWLGVGTAFGLLALSQKNDAQRACPDTCATADAANKWHTAGVSGDIATIAFVAGGVGVAAGVVLWLTAPGSSSESGTKVGIGPDGLHVRGEW